MQKTALMLIDGRWEEAASGRRIEVLDPTTGNVIGSVPDGDGADIDRAVQAAQRAFADNRWMGLGNAERAKVLWRIADLIEKNIEELAQLETLNNGMPRWIALYTINVGLDMFRYYAGWCTKVHGLTAEISNPQASFHAYTLKEPIGVVGLITPWNVPFNMACIKVAPALAAGCTCVLKPAEETPLTALRLGELLLEAGVPPGVVNVVTGYGHKAGTALAAHDSVAKVAFTGSTEVGKLILKAAAGNLKKVTLELGGKSPVVVFDDADVEKTVAGAATGIFINSGQVCIAGSRLYVHERLFDRVVTGIADVAKGMKIGSGLEPDTQIGPLISAKQLERVTGLISDGVAHGAEVVTGGRRVGTAGYFIEPTILARPQPDGLMMREEIFGPVLAALPFNNVDEVVAAANRTSYGLSAAVWTRDISRAHHLARKLQAGTVWINCQLVTDPSVPFGGYKQSGLGREFGQEGLEAYLQTKSVFAQL